MEKIEKIVKQLITKEEQIARKCYEINKLYCEFINDYTQVSWEDAPQWKKDSTIKGVKYHFNNPNATPKDSHEEWLKEKKGN